MNCCVAGNNTKSTKYDTDNNNDDDDDNNNNNLAVHDPWGDSFCPLFPGQIGIWNVGFCGGRKTRGPTEKPLEQGQEPKRNSIHIWHQVLELNPGHSDGRWVLSPLHHPPSPIWVISQNKTLKF